MRTKYTLVTAVLLMSATALVTALPAPAQSPAASIESLGWIAGGWHTRGPGPVVEEHWIKPAGGTMFGVSRAVAGNKTVFFEFLRIETRDDGIYYVAQPKGNPPTSFKLTKSGDGLAIFENPQHDMPKLISYKRNADGSVTAHIEGDEGGKPASQDFHYFPIR